MALPSQSPRLAVGPRQMMSRRKTKPGPIAIAAVVGICGLALAYVVIRPMLAGPRQAGAAPTEDLVREPLAQTPPPTTSGSRPPAQAQAPSLESLVEDARREGRLASANPASTNADTPGTATGSPAQTPASTPASSPPDAVTTALRTAEAESAANRPVVAREILLRALSRDPASDLDRSRLRDAISSLNDQIIFSPKLHPDDPFSSDYVVAAGDSLSRIASRQGLGVDWRAIQRVNRMTTENIRVGQHLKLIRGPFHAVVDKSDYRLDLYAGPPDARDEWVYIRSFTVGLGALADGNDTPLGEFTVKRNSRLINPHWVNPRTGQRFDKDDPLNPIGERWIGLRGLGDSELIEGIGIHGTIDPSSIGQQKSMGCVRMLSGDVELVYELLAEEVSLVTIQP